MLLLHCIFPIFPPSRIFEHACSLLRLSLLILLLLLLLRLPSLLSQLTFPPALNSLFLLAKVLTLGIVVATRTETRIEGVTQMVVAFFPPRALLLLSVNNVTTLDMQLLSVRIGVLALLPIHLILLLLVFN